MNEQAIVGCILGTAVGDSLGLPYEGMSARRAERVLGAPDRHRFCWGRGMISDDTEHTCMVAQSMLAADGDAAVFQRALAVRLRWWLLGVPAGIGKATLLAILKLWLGVPPRRSGVFSAGNGPAMRVALLGVLLGEDPAVLREWVRRATEITHRDPKAYWGALTVAWAAYESSRGGKAMADFLPTLREWLRDETAREFLDLIEKALQSAARGEPVATFAETIGSRKGISGYICHTVPCVVQVWWRYPTDYKKAVMEMIAAGGDTDATAAILGGIVGAGVGEEGIPATWRAGMAEWPRTRAWMKALGQNLAAQREGRLVSLCKTPYGYLIPLRNLVFLLLVLGHGVRRGLPPY